MPRLSRSVRPLAGPLAATLALLAGIVAARAALRVPSGDAAPYHAAVRAEAAALPMHVGLWFGHDVPVPTQAVDLLKPNVLVSRQYEHLTTGRRFTLLLVQTRYSRDLLGHFPPVCYVNRGFVLEGEASEDWRVDAGDAADAGGRPADPLDVAAKRYRFTLESAGGVQAIEVVNFMLAPDGAIAPDMYSLERHLTDRTKTHYGAAEVQMVFSAEMPPDDRDAAVEQFLQATRPALDAILDGYDAG